MLTQIKLIETIRIDETKRLDFFVILRIAKAPIEAKNKSIIVLWLKPKGSIVKSGKSRQCTKQIVALEIPKIS